MLLSVVSVLIVAQSSSEFPEGLMNNPVYTYILTNITVVSFYENIDWAASVQWYELLC